MTGKNPTLGLDGKKKNIRNLQDEDLESIGKILGIKGKVIGALNSINTIFVEMNEKEARKLAKDKRVKFVEQNVTGSIASSQTTSSWGLDRLDDNTQSPALNGTFNYSSTGVGQTIYILDTGLDLSDPDVAAEFGGRAEVIWDAHVADTNSPSWGKDCFGHGTEVAAIAAGSTYGVAKGATVKIAKMTQSCSPNWDVDDQAFALNWLADNTPAGTIINWSNGLTQFDCTKFGYSLPIDLAIKRAHDAGKIVVVPAGNDGCNTRSYTPTVDPYAFVVGGTSNEYLPGLDSVFDLGTYARSRYGDQIDGYAPAERVITMNQYGTETIADGTSLAAPYVSGVFAVACAYDPAFCASGDQSEGGDVQEIYDELKSSGILGTVVESDGTPLQGSTSRFISSHQW